MKCAGAPPTSTSARSNRGFGSLRNFGVQESEGVQGTELNADAARPLHGGRRRFPPRIDAP